MRTRSHFRPSILRCSVLTALVLLSEAAATACEFLCKPVETGREIRFVVSDGPKPSAKVLIEVTDAASSALTFFTTDSTGTAVAKVPPGFYSFRVLNRSTTSVCNELRVTEGARSETVNIGLAGPDLSDPANAIVVRELQGVVTDDTSALIPGAKLDVFRNETLVKELRTDGEGAFRSRLGLGFYVASVSKPGFKVLRFPVNIVENAGEWNALKVALPVAGDCRSTVVDYRPRVAELKP